MAKSKGFKVPAKRTALLKFVDGDYEGAEVECRLSAPVGMYLDLARGVEGAEQMDEMIHRFARIVIHWNLEDDEGEPIPATTAGLREVDIDFVKAMISAWLDALTAVPAPLEQPSSNGQSSLAASIPMEALSGSQQN